MRVREEKGPGDVSAQQIDTTVREGSRIVIENGCWALSGRVVSPRTDRRGSDIDRWMEGGLQQRKTHGGVVRDPQRHASER